MTELSRVARGLRRAALQARFVVGRAGWLSAGCCLLLGLSAAGWGVLAWRDRLQTAEHGQALAELRQSLHPGPAAMTAPGQAAAAEQHLRDFYAALGDMRDAEQHIQSLFAIAAETGLQLDQGEYTWAFDKNANVFRHQALLPVKGHYGQVRRFCERALLALPFAALDELSFKREAIGDEELDGVLRFTFYLKDDPRAVADVRAGRS